MEDRPGCNHALLVGERDRHALLDGRERRLEPYGAGDRRHDPVGRPCRRLDQRVLTRRGFDAAASERVFQFRIG